MKMKKILFITIIGLLLISCGKDNYDSPSSIIEGKITYQGETLGLRGTGEAIKLQLYQDGYDKKDPVAVYVGQDGSFRSVLFNGEYKLVTSDRNGPWKNSRDTTHISLKGKATVELEVIPYFTITNETLKLNDNSYEITFDINQIVKEAKIAKVILLLSKTTFVDDANNILRQDITDNIKVGNNTFYVDISDNENVSKAKALFGRVGVLTEGADQAIYSKIERLR